MSEQSTIATTLPPEAVFGRLDPVGPGFITAEAFEDWDIDEENPVELIGGWVLPMSLGNFKTGAVSGRLFSALLTLVEARHWSMSQDARHRVPMPRNSVVFPDLAIHAVADVQYMPGTESIGRVPELIIEILGKRTFERDMAPVGAKFLAYQMSGVQEYFYAWPDGREASGFVLQDGAYRPIPPGADGCFRSPFLGQALRLVPPGLRAS